MHALLSPTKVLTESRVPLRMILSDVTKFSEPMRNKSQLKTAPEWAPSDLMIARLDPCTVQPAYLFPFALPFPRPSWPQFKTSTYQSTSLRHLPLAARKRKRKKKKILVGKFLTLPTPTATLGQEPSQVDITDSPVAPGCERARERRERWWKPYGHSHFRPCLSDSF